MTSVEVHTAESKASLLRRRRSSLPPEYQDATDGEYVELRGYAPSATTNDTPSSSSSSAAATPGATGLGAATAAFQIDTQGLPLIALPFPTKPVPIPVYSVLPDGAVGPLAYESLRTTRGSGSCVLVRAGDEPTDERILCSTTYRFGPNRPPRIELLGDVACDEVYEVHNWGCHTRAQDMRTHLGTFQWRYASRAERKAAGANSLLVLDLVTTVALAGATRRRSGGGASRSWCATRSCARGTRGSTAGNGGRLTMDLRGWSDTKGAAHQMEVFVVASCITMLKKEVDRRRMHQMIVIMGAASGGS
ncbi:hypothetical protein ACCO45_005172 [Purpureocillium lilacinum]|uniref:Uncharacterized protein n=1 Tax=Purpureocillium lilacinum TaxID=33203 RepID=A0ACC4DUP6_PURLI